MAYFSSRNLPLRSRTQYARSTTHSGEYIVSCVCFWHDMFSRGLLDCIVLRVCVCPYVCVYVCVHTSILTSSKSKISTRVAFSAWTTPTHQQHQHHQQHQPHQQDRHTIMMNTINIMSTINMIMLCVFKQCIVYVRTRYLYCTKSPYMQTHDTNTPVLEFSNSFKPSILPLT